MDISEFSKTIFLENEYSKLAEKAKKISIENYNKILSFCNSFNPQELANRLFKSAPQEVDIHYFNHNTKKEEIEKTNKKELESAVPEYLFLTIKTIAFQLVFIKR